MKKKINCPVCLNRNFKNKVKINFTRFDKSYIYKYFRISFCKKCSHVFNNVKKYEIENLKKYYQQEYSKANLASENHLSPNNLKNNYELYNFIKKKIDKKETKILDVGCGTGNLLKFLKNKNFSNLSGIEPIKKYYNQIQKKKFRLIKNTNLEKFENRSKFDLIIIDQTLEHIWDLKLVIKKLKNLLNHKGYIVIGVPNFEEYNNFFRFPFFWFTIREHVHHFSETSLRFLFNDFKFIKSRKTKFYMFSNSIKMPNKYYLFQNEKIKNPKIYKNNDIEKKLDLYIKRSINSTKLISRTILKIKNNHSQIFLYGIGREFSLLYNLFKKFFKKIILIDNNNYKNKQKINNKEIFSFEYAKKKFNLRYIYVTAFTNYKEIKLSLKKEKIKLLN